MYGESITNGRVLGALTEIVDAEAKKPSLDGETPRKHYSDGLGMAEKIKAHTAGGRIARLHGLIVVSGGKKKTSNLEKPDRRTVKLSDPALLRMEKRKVHEDRNV